jgi:hypothetical protein
VMVRLQPRSFTVVVGAAFIKRLSPILGAVRSFCPARRVARRDKIVSGNSYLAVKPAIPPLLCRSCPGYFRARQSYLV